MTELQLSRKLLVILLLLCIRLLQNRTRLGFYQFQIWVNAPLSLELFSHFISSRTTLAVGLYTRISCDVMLIAPESVDNKISIKIYDPWESIFLPGTDKYPVTKFLQK